MALLLSACSAPIPDAGEKKSNQSLSKAACDAWGEKVGQAYKGITRCTQDSECVFKGDSVCGNGLTIYNRSANVDAYLKYADQYYSACNLGSTLQCNGFSGEVTCQNGYCAENTSMYPE